MTDEDFRLLCTEIRLSPSGRFILRLADTDSGLALYSYSTKGKQYILQTAYTDLTVEQCQHLRTAVGMTLYSQFRPVSNGT